MEWREVKQQEEKHPNSQLSTWSGRARLAIGILESLLRLLRPLLRGLRGPLGSLLQYIGTSEESRGAGQSDDPNRSHCICEISRHRPPVTWGADDKNNEKWQRDTDTGKNPPSPRPWQP